MPIAIDVELDLPQKEQDAIREELGVITGAARSLGPLFNLQQLLVPADFRGTVARLQPRRRPAPSSLEPLALGIAKPTGWVLVLHPSLYGPGWDAHMRYALYWHECVGLVNRMRFPALLPAKTDRYAALFAGIYRVFGEYDASRKAHDFREALLRKVLQQTLSPMAAEDASVSLKGQMALVLSAEQDAWAHFANESLAESSDAKGFLATMRPRIMQRTQALALALAAVDHTPALMVDNGPAADFMRHLPDPARALHRFMRTRHVDGSPDLTAGMELLGTLWRHWGLTLTDAPEGSPQSIHAVPTAMNVRIDANDSGADKGCAAAELSPPSASGQETP